MLAAAIWAATCEACTGVLERSATSIPDVTRGAAAGKRACVSHRSIWSGEGPLWLREDTRRRAALRNGDGCPARRTRHPEE
eukprot:scaffold7006_cov108-Isochrysis_galbana.AAC.2